MKDPQLITIINLTPHEIVILKKLYEVKDGNRVIKWVPSIVIPPSGETINCPAHTEHEASIYAGWPEKVSLTYTQYEIPEELPPFLPNTIYIVSEVVARLCPDRPDFRIVNGLIRGDHGKVLGCRSLGRIKPFIPQSLLMELHAKISQAYELNEECTGDEDIRESIWDCLKFLEDDILQLETAKG